jgi:hypothetical protein
MKLRAAVVTNQGREFVFVDLGRGERFEGKFEAEAFFKRQFPGLPILHRQQMLIGGAVGYSGDTSLIGFVRGVPLSSFSWKEYNPE